MLRIKPQELKNIVCSKCHTSNQESEILWQGMHVCTKVVCKNCKAELVDSLPVGHSINRSYQLNLTDQEINGSDFAKQWLVGESLLTSLQNPEHEEIKITKEVLREFDQVVILNCIDYLYGHCLLKLLNAQRHLEDHPHIGVIVIIQPFLKWMVPKDVAEIWTVNMPLRKGWLYYPSFNNYVRQELERFNEVWISEAHSHPTRYDLTKFTNITKHNFENSEFLVTFVWREDRLWCTSLIWRVLKKLNLNKLVLLHQNWKIQRLFKDLQSKLDTAKFAVAGLGTETRFPDWIKDCRVKKFDKDTERQTCQLYAESRLVIGVHGSSLLLPSGHAGMVIDLMPADRWGNFAQDILYQEDDSRLAAFRYRYVSLQTSVQEVAYIASTMLLKYAKYAIDMTADKT
jgi:hypothetical protein